MNLNVIVLILIGLVFPVILSPVHAFYESTLPTNTIFADDFDRNTIGFWGNASDGAGFSHGSIGFTTRAISGSGALSVNVTNSANFGDEWAVRTITTNASIIGLSCKMAFSQNMISANDGQAVACGTFYYDSSGFRHQVRVEYRPSSNFGEWALFQSNNGQPTGTSTPIVIQGPTSHGYRAFDDSSSQFYLDSSISESIVFNRATNAYVSFCAGSLCQSFSQNQYIIGVIGGALTFFPPPSALNLFFIVALDLTTITNAQGLLDNVLVTDNSPGIVSCGGGGVNIVSGTGNTNTAIQPGCITVNTSSFYMDLGLTGFLAMALTSLVVYRRRIYDFIRIRLVPSSTPSSTEP